MTPLITLYILGGCVGLAILVFIVMIVVTALRPPELPDLFLDPPPPPPIVRMIRALTPAPIAAATPVPALAAPRERFVPASTAISRPASSSQARVAIPSPPAPQVPPMQRSPAPSPTVWTPAPQAPPRVAPSPPLSPQIRHPVYPQRRSRPLRRVLAILFATVTLATGIIVAAPSLLDPLCDDYEWFGAEATTVVRQHASDAHAAIAEIIDAL